MVHVQSMRKDSTIKTGKNFADAFINRVDKLFSNSNDGRLIFDRYLEGSLKGQTRRKRTKGCNPIKYKVSDTMDIKNISIKSLLSHIVTKSELTFFFKAKVLQNYSSSNKRIITVCATGNLFSDPITPVHNHKEADTLTPLHSLDEGSTVPSVLFMFTQLTQMFTSFYWTFVRSYKALNCT